MPISIIKSFAKKTNKTSQEIENLWKRAKKEAKAMGMENKYGYTVQILKNMLGLDESLSDMFLKSNKKFNEFYEEIISSDLGDLPENPPIGSFKKRKKKDNDEEEENEEESEKLVKVGLK